MAAVLERFRRKVPNTRTRSPANEAAALAAAGAVPSSPPINGNFQTPAPAVTPSQSPLHHQSASPAHQPSLDVDGNASSSFMQKPQRGWLHPDRELRSGAGVSYGVRYIGALEVTKPMRTLDFEVRTQVAKESINRVCEAAGLKSINKKRKVERKIQSLLGERPDLHNAGFNVRLTITTDALDVVCEDGDRPGETICHHPMQGVSFASGGDAETLDFVAYVAKDATYARACHVLECGGGLAQDVLTTVGQAFELRFKEFLQNSPRATETPPGGNSSPFQFSTPTSGANDVAPAARGATDGGAAGNEAPPAGRQYYNDIPTGGSPSTRRNGGDIRGIGNELNSRGGILLQDNQPPPPIPPLHPISSGGGHILPSPTSTDSLGSTNLAFGTSSTTSSSNPFNFFPTLPPPPTSSPPPPQMGTREINEGFDPSSTQPPLPPVPVNGLSDPLYQEPWFHGKISRSQAESLLRTNGDFLVRESSHQEGQFVLTGLHAGFFKHLLLIDPQGVVRTKDKKFDNVSHLIHFHRDNHVPIVSEDSELLLVTPVFKN